jgi:hypothetical protein
MQRLITVGFYVIIIGVFKLTWKTSTCLQCVLYYKMKITFVTYVKPVIFTNKNLLSVSAKCIKIDRERERERDSVYFLFVFILLYKWSLYSETSLYILSYCKMQCIGILIKCHNEYVKYSNLLYLFIYLCSSLPYYHTFKLISWNICVFSLSVQHFQPCVQFWGEYLDLRGRMWWEAGEDCNEELHNLYP